MRLSIALVAAAAIAVCGASLGSSPSAAATALPLTPLVHEDATTANLAIEEVRYRRRGFGRHSGFRGHRFRSPRRHAFRHHHAPRHAFRHHRRDRGAAAAAGIFGFALGAMAGHALAAPHYYHGHQNAHVQWCLRRYRSYDIRSDSFLGYDGFRRRCNSPYRAW